MENNNFFKNNKIFKISIIALLIIFFDQLTKILILKNFNLNESLPIINNIFHFTYVNNTGAGFGILKGFNLILIFVAIFAIGLIFYYVDKIKESEVLLQTYFGFILGGIVGNLIDRIRLGYVVDFLDFRIWPVFNIADSFVTIGMIGLIIYLWKK